MKRISEYAGRQLRRFGRRACIFADPAPFYLSSNPTEHLYTHTHTSPCAFVRTPPRLYLSSHQSIHLQTHFALRSGMHGERGGQDSHLRLCASETHQPVYHKRVWTDSIDRQRLRFNPIGRTHWYLYGKDKLVWKQASLLSPSPPPVHLQRWACANLLIPPAFGVLPLGRSYTLKAPAYTETEDGWRPGSISAVLERMAATGWPSLSFIR